MTAPDTPRPPFAVFDLHDIYAVARHALTDPDPGNRILTVLPGPVLSVTCPNPPPLGPVAVAGYSPIAERVLELTEPVVLSLTHLPDPIRTFMATVNRGLVLGHNWLALNERPDAGLDVDTFSTLPAHLAHIDAPRIPATVDLDVLGPFDAEVLKGYGWNGWAIPTFDLEAVRAIGQALAGQNTDPDQVTVVQIDGGIVTLIEQAGTDEEERAVYEPDERGRYGLGAGSWCWSINTTPTLPNLGPPDLRLWFPWRLARAVTAHALACLDHDRLGYVGGGSSAGTPGLFVTIQRGSAAITSTGRSGSYDPYHGGFSIADRPLRRRGQPAPDHAEYTVFVPASDLSCLAGRVADRCDAWLVLDVRFDLPGMGGVPHVIAHQAFQRDDLDPATVTWHPAQLSCKEFEGVYPGQVAEGAHAGLAGLIARFDRDTIGQMVAATAPGKGRPGAVWVQAIGDSVQLCRTTAMEQGEDMLQLGWAPLDGDGMYLLGAHQLTWTEIPSDI